MYKRQAEYKQFIEACNTVDCIKPLLSSNKVFNNIIRLLFHLHQTDTIKLKNVGLNTLLQLLGVGTQLDDLGIDANLMWLASNAKQFTYHQYMCLVSIHFDLTIIIYEKFKSKYISLLDIFHSCKTSPTVVLLLDNNELMYCVDTELLNAEYYPAIFFSAVPGTKGEEFVKHDFKSESISKVKIHCISVQREWRWTLSQISQMFRTIRRLTMSQKRSIKSTLCIRSLYFCAYTVSYTHLTQPTKA